MEEVFYWMVGILALAWAWAYFGLRGRSLVRFDQPRQPPGEHFSTGPEPNVEHRAVVAVLKSIQKTLKEAPHRGRLGLLRQIMDGLFSRRELPARFTPVDAGGVPAEWVTLPDSIPTTRLLYIHGGSYISGSPLSHRTLTSKFAEVSGAAVLAIDYRLMPEHSRMAGIEDCRAAYQWMLDNGPDVATNGPSRAGTVFVAGDSAGGNLCLSLLAWLRDQKLRIPDAAVALSPQTDSTLGSPSLRTNARSDKMLGPVFGPLTRTPRTVLLYAAWLQNRMRPCNPLVSPLHGDLSGLPPLLIHAGSAEMLLDDCRRYVNKAVAAGSPVRLQTWDHVVHVWHIFNPELTEARDAFEEIRKFLNTTSA